MSRQDQDAQNEILQCIYQYGITKVQAVLDTIVCGARTKAQEVQEGGAQNAPQKSSYYRKSKKTKTRSRKDKKARPKKRRVRISAEQQEHDMLILSFFQRRPGATVNEVKEHLPDIKLQDLRRALKRLLFHEKLRSEPVPGQRSRRYYAQ